MKSSLTPEEEARARRMQAGVDHITSKILAACPSAGSAQTGGLFDSYGSAVWTPSRAAGLDFSAWGTWEAWEHQEIILGSPRPTGDWVAWDSATGAQIGYGSKTALSGRAQAEMTAVMMNEGRKTRVVSASGSFRASALKYSNVAAEVDPRTAALRGGQSHEDYVAEVEGFMAASKTGN